MKRPRLIPSRQKSSTSTRDLIWLSDIHADSLMISLAACLTGLKREQPRAILITGDIADAGTLKRHLTKFASAFHCPIYFVLGNHDFYGSSFAAVDQMVRNICSKHRNLVHLENHEPIWLNESTALVGCRGWGDGRAGIGSKATEVPNDLYRIQDLSGRKGAEYFKLLAELGRASARHFLKVAPGVLKKARNLIVATHVPPFVKSALMRYGDEFLPYYVNMALGRAILRVARAFPNRKISVLCGHTHMASQYRPLPNVTVHMAKAEYETFRIAGRLSLAKRSIRFRPTVRPARLRSIRLSRTEQKARQKHKLKSGSSLTP